jgi:hypothetical protein
MLSADVLFPLVPVGQNNNFNAGFRNTRVPLKSAAGLPILLLAN